MRYVVARRNRGWKPLLRCVRRSAIACTGRTDVPKRRTRERGLARYAIALVGFLTLGSATASIDNTSCFALDGDAGVAACGQLAQAIGANKHRLNAHAEQLERHGRPEAALEMYKVAAAYFPDDRRALTGVIRSRARSRARRLVLDIAPEVDELSACWRERWLDALASCQREAAAAPRDARLQERLGDVLRSIGKVSEAQAAYGASLALTPDNPNLRRKRAALAVLLGEEAAEPAATPEPSTFARAESQAETNPARTGQETTPKVHLTEPTPEPVSVANESPQISDAVAKLELLERLYAKRLIREEEYQSRREAILNDSFASSTSEAPIFRGLPGGKFHALVVGNADYESFPNLDTAVTDARAVESMLSTRYGFTTQLLTNASRYDVLSALAALRSIAGPEDSVLLYYAGHGVLDQETGQGYWLPVNAETDSFARWLSTADITAALAGSRAKHALVIADSCFAGTLVRDASGSMRTARWQRLAAKRSRTVMTSGGLEPVIDGGGGAHSVFAAALLESLRSNGDVLEAGQLFVAVRDRVVLAADQTPEYAPLRRAGHDGGDFLFVPQTLRYRAGTD